MHNLEKGDRGLNLELCKGLPSFFTVRCPYYRRLKVCAIANFNNYHYYFFYY